MFARPTSAFLHSKMKELNLNKKELAELINISPPLLSELINERKQFPALETLNKIANAFDVQIDHILGREKYIINDSPVINTPVLQNDILKDFIVKKLKYEKVRINDIAKLAGITSNSIRGFLNGNTKLGTATISKLANHWHVSIDEMIGRVSPSKDIAVQQTKFSGLSDKISSSDLDKIKNIKSSIQKNILSSSEKSSTKNSSQKSKSFVERIQQERANKSTFRKR